MVTPGAAPLLEAARIVRRFGTRTVLDIEHIAVHAGEVLAIVGPNGAGKSTLFRILLLLERPDEGTVHLDGVTMRTGDARARGRLAAVFQRPVLFSGTVRHNLAFGLRARGVPQAERQARVDEALQWMQLDALADTSVHALSGGEAQRVALGRALIMQPDVVLLDEPTANLDVVIRRRFRMDIDRVARQQARAIVLITHDTSEAFGLADRVVVLHDGRVAQAGRPDELLLRPATPFIAELTGAELLLPGQVELVADGLAAVRVSPALLLWATPQAGELQPGVAAVVAYRPEDVTLTLAGAQDTSAMNRISATVAAIVPAGALTRIRLSAAGAALTALVTRRSVEQLGLATGTAVVMQLKAAALHAWQRDVHDS
jgi:tungstate transport system ATP-binding protein